MRPSTVLRTGFEDRLDSLIRYHAERLWPGVDWRLIKAQALTESGLRPKAASPCGAVGLLQLMPATFAELSPKGDIHDADDNLEAGVRYLREQFERFPEIAGEAERVRFALASYNCGRGYVNKAVSLARAAQADWRRWESVAPYLAVPQCEVCGLRPDHRQVRAYVQKVMETLEALKAEPHEKEAA